MTTLEDFARLTDVAWRRSFEVERGIYIAEGLTTIERAISAGHAVQRVISADRWVPALLELGVPGDRIDIHTEPELEAITGFHVHRGALAAFQRPQLPSVSELLPSARRLVVLEDIVDHTNVGAIMRSAAAFDIDAVLLTPGCADPLYRRAVKVSMGTVFQIPWTRIDWPAGLELLRAHDFATLAFTPAATALDLRALPASVREQRLALVMGTEGEGLSGRTMQRVDHCVRIPMAHGVDSLNVAAATAVACYELTR